MAIGKQYHDWVNLENTMFEGIQTWDCKTCPDNFWDLNKDCA